MTNGGVVYENFLSTCCGIRSKIGKTWRRILTTLHVTEAQEDIVFEARSKFHGWLLVTCSSLGRNGRKQMFFTTFIGQYHGLSYMGSDLISRFGFTMRKTMYLSQLEKTSASARDVTRYLKNDLRLERKVNSEIWDEVWITNTVNHPWLGESKLALWRSGSTTSPKSLAGRYLPLIKLRGQIVYGQARRSRPIVAMTTR